MTIILNKCDCTQRGRLDETGKTDPEWICACCGKEYWRSSQNELVSEKPAKWPAKEVTYKTKVLKDGRWVDE